MYKYANKHFNQHQRDQIWRNINTVRDVEIKSNFCNSHISSISKLHPKDRIREDIIEAEKALGEFEMALNRINMFPDLFNLTEREIISFQEKFPKYVEELKKLDLQRISW